MPGMKTIICANEKCPRGIDGRPREFVPVRHWQRCCCSQCRMAVASKKRREDADLARAAREGAE